MIVGITAGVETMTSGPWVELTTGSPAAYAAAVQRAGARAVLLVPDEGPPGEMLDLVGALIVTGASGDLDPALYGASPHHETRPVAPPRDAFEIALIHGAVECGLPVLGVCRGMQTMNVAHGGSLIQHLPDVLGHDHHRGEAGSYATHSVRLAPGSLAARAVGAAETDVRSYHHQGVDRVGEGLVPSAWSDDPEAIVEAVERPGQGFCLGVLWHPEEDERSRVIAALVEAEIR